MLRLQNNIPVFVNPKTRKEVALTNIYLHMWKAFKSICKDRYCIEKDPYSDYMKIKNVTKKITKDWKASDKLGKVKYMTYKGLAASLYKHFLQEKQR